MRESERKRVEFSMSDKQQTAIKLLDQSDVDELLYGGAKGGGKSVFGCQWVVGQAVKIINKCKIQPSDKPPVIGFMGRKQSVDFSTTTLETWKRFIPGDMYEFHKQDKLIIINKTVAIRYGGMDDSDTVKKFNSAEFAFYFVDQAEECSESDIGLLRGTLRFKFNGVQPEYKGLLTANPAICWLKKAFITAPQEKTRFVKALPSDNPFIDAQAYVAQLKKAFSFNPQLLSAYLYGSWDDLDSAFTVIPSKAIEACVNSGYASAAGEKRVTVCDISEDGRDETVIYDFVGTAVQKETAEIYTHRDLMDSVGRIMAHQKKNKSNLICIDKIGLGAGVYSRLLEIYSDPEDESHRVTVYGFDSRISAPGPLNDMTFKNYRAYAWFKAAEYFKDRHVDIPDDPVLIGQLAGVTWHFTHGDIIVIDDKDDIKEALGQSPDRADTLVMGLDAVERAPAIRKRDVYADRPQFRKKRRSWATV